MVFLKCPIEKMGLQGYYGTRRPVIFARGRRIVGSELKI